MGSDIKGGMGSGATAKARLVQTFKFLKELNELRNPVARDLSGHEVLRLGDWPSHPCVLVRRGDAVNDDEAGEATAEMEPIVCVERARLTQCPAPPDVLDGWLKPGWHSVNMAPTVLETRNLPSSKGQTVTVAFRDSADRMAAFASWNVEWKGWAEAEQPAVAARAVFEKVHELWTRMQRESDSLELVLADGMLGLAKHEIRYPVLTQRIRLEFDPVGPRFRFSTGTERVELHRALLRLVPSVEARMIAHFEKELETQPVAPLGGDMTDGFLRRLVHGLFTDGEFVEDRIQRSIGDHPILWREPLLILRARTAGLSTTLDHIVEDLERDDARTPEGLSRIVGVEPSSACPHKGAGDAGAPVVSGTTELDILFSKPTNDEQYQIAARLARSKAVLVQGPPGTGKTHTIANLLGHLLAQGKTVLVTAHTTKALRVLREKIDPALQPLCLSVLEGGGESQSQLSHAAQAIVERLSKDDAASLRREAALLRGKRRRLLDEAESVRRKLRDARFSEVDEIVFGGTSVSPINAAKLIKESASRDGWIPAPIQPGTQCPLVDDEVHLLYASQGALTPGDETQLQTPQPEIVRLLKSADFRLLATEQTDANVRARADRPDLWVERHATCNDSSHLQQVLGRVQHAAATLSEDQTWLREVLFAGWVGGEHAATWHDLLAAIEEMSNEAAVAQRLIGKYGPELPDLPRDTMAATLDAVIAFLEGGSSLGFMTKITRPSWHQLIEACRVEGRVPRAVDEFRALRSYAQLSIQRTRLVSRWRRTVEEGLGGPRAEDLGPSPERSAQAYALEIRKRLEWREKVWEPLLNGLLAAGFRWERWLSEHPAVPGDHGELARVQRAGSMALAHVVEARAALMQRAELGAALDGQRSYLTGFPQSEAGAVLLEALRTWNVGHYEEAYREIARLEGLHGMYGKRLAFLAKLRPVASAWADGIAQRVEPHHLSQPPGDLAAAWRWRQWHQELEHRAAVSMTDLQSRLDNVESELRGLAGQIIEHETWAAQRERTSLAAQQALVGFVQTLRKVGKGTGKRAPELMRKARELLASAHGAVPVWIMPLNRVYESFDPRETRFDVVIIDEASQSDVTALAALYLGHEHVVVGDKEQVTPDAVGQRVEEVERLIATNLQGIPNSHLYDGQTSIYDLAEAAFGGVVALREHFRCVPEIIQFSNHLSYGNAMRPLREPLSASVRPAVVSHRVRGFRRKGSKTNEAEAQEIASLIAACLGDPSYCLNELRQPTSYGVISLLGDEQALHIDKLLRRRLSPDVLAKHRVLCGNAAQFQGDERDVIFLSMVDEPPEDGQLTYRDAGPKDIYKKRYNVAVSRARNQLWVVHSLDPGAHLKAGDLRRRLIEHARDPNALLRTLETQATRVDSVFEKLVLERLVLAGYRVQTQFTVGAFRIDLVVEGETRRLAVECDGELWHTPEQLHKDLERQAILERLGWRFERIRGSVFFRDPAQAMAPVFAKLANLGIEARGTSLQDEEGAAPSIVVERIRRSAEALRAEWLHEEAVSA